MRIDYDFTKVKPEGVFLWNGGTTTNPNNFDQTDSFLKPYSGFLSSYDGPIHNGIVCILPVPVNDLYVRCRAKFDRLPTYVEFCLLYSQRQPPIGTAAGDETLNVKLHDVGWLTSEHGGGDKSAQMKGPSVNQWFQFWAHYRVNQPALKNYSTMKWSLGNQEPLIGSANCRELLDGTLTNPIDRVVFGLAHSPSLFGFADLTIADGPIGDYIVTEEPPTHIEDIKDVLAQTSKAYDLMPPGDAKTTCGFLIQTQKLLIK